ncbi:MAG TPA: TolC family protein [Bryobacteraceae bacterium]|jgi:outer membrane protein|nr:TolC family protein [Bryobacteraceae bacterium]
MRTLLLICTSLTVVGQGDGPVQRSLPLSMKRAVEIALTPEGSPRVSIAMETIKQAEMRKAESRAAFLPDIEAAINDRRQTTNLHAFGLNFPIPIPGLAFPTTVGPFNVLDARATVSQTVFDFSTMKRYQSSKVSLDAAKDDFDATKNQVSDQVARAYLTTLRADAALETAQANVDLSQALLTSAQNQKEAGTGTGIEVVRAQVQLANDKQRLVVAENDRRRAGLNLLRAIGLKLDATVEATDKLAYEATDIGHIDAALADARKTRAELKAQQDRESSARLTSDSVKWERLPSVGASADYGSIGSQIIGAMPTYTYGVSVRFPVFDGGRRDARRIESLSQYRQEQTRTRDLEQQVDLDVRLAFDSIHSAATEVAAAQEGVQLAEQEVAQARRRYEAGVTNSIEVTDAQTRLDRARNNRINALYDYNVARIDLATATGRIREYVNQ